MSRLRRSFGGAIRGALKPFRGAIRLVKTVARGALKAAKSVGKAALGAAKRLGASAMKILPKGVQKAVKSVGKMIRKTIKNGIKLVKAFVGKDLKTFIRSPGKMIGRMMKGAKLFFKNPGKAIKGAFKRVVTNIKNYANKIRELIIAPILKRIRALITKALGPLIKKILPLAKKLIGPLIEASASRGGQFGVDSLSRWASYVEGGQLDKERIKKEIFERIRQWAEPTLKEKVEAVFNKIFKPIRFIADQAADGALTGIGSIPLVGWLLAAVVQEGYNFLMSEAQRAITDRLIELIAGFARKIFDKTAGKLLDKLVPKVNAFLKKSGLSEAIATLVDALPGAKEAVEAQVAALRDRASSWSDEVEARARDAIGRIVVADHKLAEIAGGGVAGEEGAAAEGGEQ